MTMSSHQISPSRFTRSIHRSEIKFIKRTFTRMVPLVQVSCILECHIEIAISKMKDEDKCIPWYFPPPNSGVRLCSPYEARSFNKEIDLIDDDECKVVTQLRINSLSHYVCAIIAYHQG